MKRAISSALLEWKKREGRKPLILKGVRQCGKTFILNQFGRENYDDVAYFNFEGHSALAGSFEQDLVPERILTELGILCGKKINPHRTLIIFDEIQFCGRALTSLKYFCEEAPDYHIVCAGSLIGIALAKPASFPVGKVEFLTLRPMSFYEFALAHGEQMLLDHIDNATPVEPLAEIFADKLSTLLKNYYITGGMPEVVAKWIETKDVAAIDRIQENILNSYELDFSKHAPLSDFPKIAAIWKTIPDQLAKENGKFIYGHAKPGARAKDLEDALEWLVRAGMVYKVHLVERPSLPLSAYAKQNFFKVFMADVGLLRKLSKLPASVIYDEVQTYKEFKGALTENYVLTELINTEGNPPYYWRSGNSAEVDFVVQMDDLIIPIEVKSGKNLKSKSLSIYRQRYEPRLAIRTSLQGIKVEGPLLNLPLYLLWMLHKAVKLSAHCLLSC